MEYHGAEEVVKRSKANQEAAVAGTGSRGCKVSLGLEVEMNANLP